MPGRPVRLILVRSQVRRPCHRAPGRLAFLIIAAAWVLALPAMTPAAEREQEGFQVLTAAVHVHSNLSTGTLDLDQLAERADRLGIDAIVMSDNFALRYDYGLFPFRGVLRKTVTVPSISHHKADDFLREIAEAQARHPRVLFVPGVEVGPHYYWSGSLLTRNLTMHNSQRNLLVLGMPRAEDYTALPLSGNPASYRYGWSSLLNLSPVLLFIPAGWLWAQSNHRASRPGIVTWKETGHRFWAALLATTAFLLLLNAWPLSQPVFSAYTKEFGYRPYQAVIDAASSNGGLVVWSLPEARDFHRYSFGSLGTVTVQTEPHPEALRLTNGYTGFGGLYQDTRHMTDPGNIWDQAIQDSLAGERPSYPVLFGEIAFHEPGQAGIDLYQVLNVLRVPERSVRGILEAMRHGRLYAVRQYHPDMGLRLDEFRVNAQGSQHMARSGDTLSLDAGRNLVVQISVSATNRGAHPIVVTLIRSGEVVARAQGTTPFSYRFSETLENNGAPSFYRVAVHGAGEILSNPIFIVPEKEAVSQSGELTAES